MTTALPLAVQLYSFRDESRRGSEQFTLDRELFDELARLGYGGVETVGVPGGDVVAAREALAQAGLAVTSTHSWASIDDADKFDRVCADAAAIGSPWVIVSGGHFQTRDEIARFADSLNAGAAIAARHGIGVGLHNHDLEMHDVEGGGPAYALIRDATDPSVGFQVDIFWVFVGGASPAAVILDLGSRVRSLHVKDGLVPPPSASGGHRFANSAVGSGVVEPAPAIEAAATAGSVEWLIVELDHADGPVIDAVTGSIEYLVSRGLARSSRA
jgi:sugar phosphate isomerase/epimerase